MKIVFVQDVTRKQAKKACPWESKTVKVCGGYLCFESINDYKTWSDVK